VNLGSDNVKIYSFIVKMNKTANFYLDLVRFSSVIKVEVFLLHLF